MAITGNFKGTSQSEFKIGKSTGNKIITGIQPEVGTAGDLFIDSSNASINVYNGSEWTNIGNTLTELRVDDGTLSVDNLNDTVSIGSTASNEKLFVNGNLRLGTNPSVQHSGAFMDLRHSNGSTTSVRIRDNTSGTDPVFKVYNAHNQVEAFRVQGSAITINESYTLPITDGSAGQALVTDGEGNLTFASVTAPVDDYGSITDAAVVTSDYGSLTEDTREPTPHDSYTVSQAQSLVYVNAGDMIFVSDEAGGATMAFYDGANWRRIQDREIIS